MRIVIFGTGGMLGRLGWLRLRDRCDADAVLHSRRAAVFTAPSPAKQRPGGQVPIAAAAIDALSPHRVAAHCRTVGSPLVQEATDGVFSGHRDGYCETEALGPPDVPGCAKLLGKLATQGC